MSSKSKKAGNLVALGSAAVVAVYGTGFMRTAAAAERFAEQSDERVLSPEDAAAAQSEMKTVAILPASSDSNDAAPAARLAGAPTNAAPVIAVRKADATLATVGSKVQSATTLSASAPSASAAAAARDVSVPASTKTATVSASGAAAPTRATEQAKPLLTPPAVQASAGSDPVAEKPTTTVGSPNASAPVSSSSTVPAPSAPIAPAPITPAVTAAVPVAPTPVVPAPVVSAPVVPAPVVPAPVVPPVTATAAPTVNEAPKLKDGEYTGYGTSRHGDVEVYLETTDGRITYVKISQCLTQYSCSWIADLPKQVLARQSARVDGVSGATQSANAFYYAVVQALAKAK